MLSSVHQLPISFQLKTLLWIAVNVVMWPSVFGKDRVQAAWNTKIPGMMKCKREFVNTYYWLMNVSKELLSGRHMTNMLFLALFNYCRESMLLFHFSPRDSRLRAWKKNAHQNQFPVVGTSPDEAQREPKHSTRVYCRQSEGVKFLLYTLTEQVLVNMTTL